MLFWYYPVLLFFITISFSHEADEFYNFSLLNSEAYAECIKGYLSDEILTYFDGEVTGLEDVFNRVALIVARHWVTYWPSDMSEEEIFKELDDIIETLHLEDLDYGREDVPWQAIKMATGDALMDTCSDEAFLLNNFQIKNEPKVVSEILDYVLVDWPASLYNLSQTQEGLLSMRNYADDALKLLARAFLSYNHEEFRMSIRALWMRRALRYFDNRDDENPHISHYYSNNRARLVHSQRTRNLIHTSVNRILHNTSLYETWADRNPQVSQEDFNRILDIHVADRSSYQHEIDIFEVFQRNGMSAVEYYFERHNDQFYRVLFFVLELQTRNISISEDRSLSPGLVPDEIYEMLRNDTVYRDYLLRLRNIYGDPYGSRLRRNLASSSRVCEEDLIELLITEQPTDHIGSTMMSTTTTSMASTNNETSHRKRNKWSISINCHRKDFIKRPRVTSSEQQQAGTPNYGFVTSNIEVLPNAVSTSFSLVIRMDH